MRRVCAGTAALVLPLVSVGAHAQPAIPVPPDPAVLENVVIYESQGRYCAWPSIVRAGTGDLLVFFTETEEHLGQPHIYPEAHAAQRISFWAGIQYEQNQYCPRQPGYRR